MDRFGWPNVPPSDAVRHWAYIACVATFQLYAALVLTMEIKKSSRTTQDYLKATDHSRSHMILLRNIPLALRDEQKLHYFFSQRAHDHGEIYLVRNLKTLRSLIEAQEDLCDRLERMQTKMIRENASIRQKAGGSLVAQLYRPTVCGRSVPWLPPLPFVGRREDEISMVSSRLTKCRQDVDNLRDMHRQSTIKSHASALLSFKNHMTACALANSVCSTRAGCMIPQLLETQLKDVVYANLGTTWEGTQLRYLLVRILCILLILGWTVPIGDTGMLSQLSYLGQLWPPLADVMDLPLWLTGFLQGVLPQVTFTCLMLIFPILLRKLVELQKLPTKVAIELTVQRLYFIFLFAHLFLNISISSGLMPFLVQVTHSPSSIPVLLAQNLPKASNYFLSYISIQALTFGATALLQLRSSLTEVLKQIRPPVFTLHDPLLARRIPVIWLPKDVWGLSDAEVERCSSCVLGGVFRVTNQGANMDEKGRVHIGKDISHLLEQV